MINRRSFLKKMALGSLVPLNFTSFAGSSQKSDGPVVISTWKHGLPANKAAWKILKEGGRALDGVDAGVRIPEADAEVRTVSSGGYSERDGIATLDAGIMDGNDRGGSV